VSAPPSRPTPMARGAALCPLLPQLRSGSTPIVGSRHSCIHGCAGIWGSAAASLVSAGSRAPRAAFARVRGCRISPPRRQDRRFAATNHSRSSSRRAENASDQMVGGAQLVVGDLCDSLVQAQESRSEMLLLRTSTSRLLRRSARACFRLRLRSSVPVRKPRSQVGPGERALGAGGGARSSRQRGRCSSSALMPLRRIRACGF
jgi:hypothetical protein